MTNSVGASLPGAAPSEAAIEAAAIVRWERTESDSSPTRKWPDAPSWIQQAFRETATLELRAAYAVDRGAALEAGPSPSKPSAEAIDAAIQWLKAIRPVNMTDEGYRNWARRVLESAYAVDRVAGEDRH